MLILVVPRADNYPEKHMLYQAYQTYVDMTAPLRAAAATFADALETWSAMEESDTVRKARAFYELLVLTGLTHQRPAFGIETVRVDQQEVAVQEETVYRTPFCALLHFKKDAAAVQPRVLLVAPMSGHFATLLRGTVRTLLADHDVFITDWINPRDVALAHGRFGLSEFVSHLMDFLDVLGPGAHIMAVCQPTVAALAAVALMAEDGHPAQPRSMVLMAGPNDARINPTQVNVLANSKPIEWFESHLIDCVPWRFTGALRRVYPGFMQLAAFINMNPERHVKALSDLYTYRARDETQKADVIHAFYEEYFAMMDLAAEFYLETVSLVFQRHALALGELEVMGRRVDLSAIRRTALLTVEGERDDICAVGQTLAAQEMCCSLRPLMKTHHVQTDVGHYGVFSGRRWETEIYPIVRDVIHLSQ